MSFSVMLTESAARDLEEIDAYLAREESPQKADAVLERFESIFSKLENAPERGSFPKELSALGIREYRQLFFKPYRVIYRIIGREVYVMLIVDGRRDLQTLLERRLLEGE